MFLTPDELADLTGRKRPSAQIAWLTEHKWRFAMNAAGHPRVLRAYCERRLLGKDAQVVDFPAPDWSAARM